MSQKRTFIFALVILLGAGPIALRFAFFLVGQSGLLLAQGSSATQTAETPAVVRHAPTLSGRFEGSLQLLTGENVALNGGAVITRDLLVPGTPTLVNNGAAVFGGTVAGTGSSLPTGYRVSLSRNSQLGRLVTRTDPVNLAPVPLPPASSGTRDVVVNTVGQNMGSFSTVRDLTLNAGVGLVTVPPGTYRKFSSNRDSGFVFGVAGSAQPLVYNLDELTLNSTAQLQVAGPVVINVAKQVALARNVVAGSETNPKWLMLNIAQSGISLATDSRLSGIVRAPAGQASISGRLKGVLACDTLSLNSSGVIQLIPNQAPTVNAGPDLTINLTEPANLNGTASDDGLPIAGTLAVSWSKVSGPGTATFVSPASSVTAVTFSEAGTYVLRLTATDSQLTTSDEVTVNVQPVTGLPTLSLVNPNSGTQGQTLNVALTGQFTNFAQGTTAVSFGTGITVNTVTVTNPTSLTTNITIAAEAAAGARTVTATTGAEIVSLVNAFTVTAGTPIITLVNPNSGQQGQQSLDVAITGQFTHFAQGTTQVTFGAGITVNTLTVTNASSLTANVSIAANASAGSRTVTVTTGVEVASLANGFMVSNGTPVITLVTPNSGQQGQQALDVAITAQFTHFAQGTTQVSLGAGITVNTVTVTSATNLTANVSVAANAATGARTVTATTGAEVASLANGFTVAAATPVITLLNPSSGQQGQTLDVAVTSQFTNFVQGTTAASFGAGITVNAVTVTSLTSLTANISVAANATAGSRTVSVTTGAEVGTLVDSFTVGTGAPEITLVNPNTGQPGQTPSVAITGQFTNFVQGQTAVSFGAGITVNTVTVASSTSLSAAISIASNAAAGARTVTVTTGAEVASLTNGFTVAPTSGPQISDFNPKTGPVGTLIAITGTNLQPTSGSPQVTLAAQAGESMQAPVSSFTATSIQFVIPTGAATGLLTVTVGTQSASSATPLTVTPSSTFTLTALPATATAMPGQAVSYALSLSSTTGFSQLASLALSGVPSGVTANSQPAQITAGQTSVLTLQVPSAQPLTSTSFSVSATATVEGLPVSQSAALQLTVVAASTSFVGRTVVDDALQTPIAGVTVKMLGQNGNLGSTECSGSTASDAAGNFALTGLGTACAGQQLVGYDGLTATSPEGKYAGVDLVYTLVGGQVTASPVLVHLPRIDGRETFNVQQNSTVDQTYAFTSIPGVSVTVYAGTTFTMPDGSTPSPFPLVAIQVPIDRLPETMPFSPSVLNAFIVAFQPANAHTNQPVAVSYPNTINTPPGTNMPLMTLDPTRGRMVPYGTATVSVNGTRIVPDLDPAVPGHRYGIKNFDWHGPAPAPQPPNIEPRPPCQPSTPPCPAGSCCPEPACPTAPGSQPVELASGRETVTATDIAITGGRGSVSVVRNYRSLSTFAGPFGIGTNHNFGYLLDRVAPQNDLAVNLILPEGNRFPFSRQDSLQPFTNGTIPALRGVTLTAFPDGHAEVRWKDGRVFRFAASTPQILPALESITDANGNRITLTRNPGNPVQITQITDPVGRALNFTYDGANRITAITDPIGRTVRYSYNPQGTLETVTDPEGSITRFEYDTQNRLTRHVDARNVTIAQNTYNANGHVTEQTLGDGGILRFDYTLMNPVAPTSPITATTVTDAAGRRTGYRFDATGLLTDLTDDVGQLRRLERSPESNNQVTAHKGTASCPSCSVSSAGDQSFKYDDRGNVIEQKDALGNATTYTFESVFNKVTSIRDALGNTTSFTYDLRGNLLTRTDANQKITSYLYDASGLLTETTDPLGQKTTFAYDSFGHLIRITDALGQTTQFRYDGISRQIEVRDSLGRTSRTEYDKLGRVVKQTDAKGQNTTFVYDRVGNLLSLTDARSKTTSFTYDEMNRLKIRTDPRGKTDSRTYDLNGNLTSFTDRRGQTSTFVFDSLNRLTEEHYADGAVVRRTYDATGRLIQVEDSVGGTSTFDYDLPGRLLSSTGPFGTLTYQRDALGRVSHREVVGQPGVDYGYDPVGNLLSAAMPQAAANLTYDGRNQPLRITRLNGVATDHTYDQAGRLLSIVHSRGATVLHSLGYSYDAAGNRISQQTSAAQPLATQPASATYDDANRLIQRSGTTFAYDDNGNLILESGPAGTTTYTWDSRNRLTRITAPNGQNAEFLYDFAGNLIRQTDTGPTLNRVQTFVLDEITNVAYQSSSDGGAFSVLTGPSIDSHWATVRTSGEVEYALTDAINSTVATVDQTGAVRGRFFYEPFGETTASASGFPFQFTGRVPVSSSLYYYRARFYNPTMGRFVSEDPIDYESGDVNLYRYVGSDPVQNTDPSGLMGRRPQIREEDCAEECQIEKCVQCCERLYDATLASCIRRRGTAGQTLCLGLAKERLEGCLLSACKKLY